MTAAPAPHRTSLPAALHDLAEVLAARHQPTSTPGQWRWQVRRRLGDVRDALLAEAASAADGWTAARAGQAERRRTALLARIAVLGREALEHPDVDVVRLRLERLLADARRHAQRVHDLAYDEVELELGGSE